MTKDPKPPSPHRRSERTHDAILAATIELLSEIGYAKLTIEAIAARAGAGKQTIYRWWPSKSAVAMDAFRRLVDSQGGTAFPDTGDLEADLKPVMRAVVDECLDPKYDIPARVMIAEAQLDEGFGSQIAEFMLRPAIDSTKARLRSARDAGQLRQDLDLDVVAELLFGPVFHRWTNRTGALTHAYADTIVDYTLRAIRI